MALRDLDPLHESHVLGPNETRRVTYDLPTSPGATTISVAVRVVGVVYDDNSAFGDPKTTEGIFADRQARRDTYVSLLVDLRAAIAKGARFEDLEELLALTQAKREKYADPGTADGLLQNLNNAKMRIALGVVDPGSALHSLERLLTFEHAAAARHSNRAK